MLEAFVFTLHIIYPSCPLDMCAGQPFDINLSVEVAYFIARTSAEGGHGLIRIMIITVLKRVMSHLLVMPYPYFFEEKKSENSYAHS